MAGVCALPPHTASQQQPPDDGDDANNTSCPEQKAESATEAEENADKEELKEKEYVKAVVEKVDESKDGESHEKECEEPVEAKNGVDEPKEEESPKPVVMEVEEKKSPQPMDQDEVPIVTKEENVPCKDETAPEPEAEPPNPPAAEPEPEKPTVEKRPISDEAPSEQCPTKKLCQELQDTFPKHDSTLSDYISSLSYNNDDELGKHIENLMSEIEVLRDLANAKEVEWNHLIHLRKVKEEILLRLLRKRNMLSLERAVSNISESNKEIINKQILELSKACVDDKNDEVTRLRHKQGPMSGNGVQLNSSGLMMVPVSTGMYCQQGMNNFNFDNHMGMNPYAAKNMMHKQSMMLPPGHRMQDFQMPDMNGQSNRYNQQMGRQGPIKDVQSIIADHRQRYPEIAPRRGRRMKSLMNSQLPPRMPVPHPEPNIAELGMLFGGAENNPHLSSVDAAALQQNIQAGNMPNGMSFKDVLVQFANMTGQQQSSCMNTRLPPPPPYPEVTLHPVGAPPASISSSFSPKMTQQQQQTNSLLHGILTKSQPRQDNRFSTFSPTLARLLTAPEKNLVSSDNPCRSGNGGNSNNFISQKGCSEITITAVQPQNNANNNTSQQSRPQPEVVQLDDFEETELEDDSADRPLVIDESGRNETNANNRESGTGSVELGENEVPECQGCRKREAQFVCAGCANQWYCSRECQVSAWDDHSEVCSG